MSKIPNLFIELKEKNITQKVLSEHLGVSTGNVSDWKSGKSMPSADVLYEISKYLNVSTDYLLGKTEQKNKPSDENRELTDKEEEFVTLFRQLSTEQQEVLLRAVGLDPKDYDKG